MVTEVVSKPTVCSQKPNTASADTAISTSLIRWATRALS